jgi:uncharacterized glyoxalase superfamily protein PhnB
MRYHNANPMIEWLCRAFGFEKHAIYPNADGSVMHAELTFGNGMIMIGEVSKPSPYSQYAIQPDETGGRETRSISLLVDDCDAIYASAKAAGAEIVFDLEAKPYGGKSFSCLDPEGHLWNIGSYNPWAVQPQHESGSAQ